MFFHSLENSTAEKLIIIAERLRNIVQWLKITQKCLKLPLINCDFVSNFQPFFAFFFITDDAKPRMISFGRKIRFFDCSSVTLN